MSFGEIIFWILARLAPALWYAHRLRYFLEIAVRVFEDDEHIAYLADYADARADLESKIADFERVLDIIIGLKVAEALGHPPPASRPRLGLAARIHAAPSIEHLAARLRRLLERYGDINRLVRRRAARLRRERDAAPVLLGPVHSAPPNETIFTQIALIIAPICTPIRKPAWTLGPRAPP